MSKALHMCAVSQYNSEKQDNALYNNEIQKNTIFTLINALALKKPLSYQGGKSKSQHIHVKIKKKLLMHSATIITYISNV